MRGVSLPKDARKVIGQRVRDLRKKKGLYQKDLGKTKDFPYDRSTWCAIESAKPFSKPVLTAAAKALGTNFSYLTRGLDVETKPQQQEFGFKTNPMKFNVGRLLAAVREKTGQSQGAVENALGWCHSTCSYIERGAGCWDRVGEYARYLDVEGTTVKLIDGTYTILQACEELDVRISLPQKHRSHKSRKKVAGGQGKTPILQQIKPAKRVSTGDSDEFVFSVCPYARGYVVETSVDEDALICDDIDDITKTIKQTLEDTYGL